MFRSALAGDPIDLGPVIGHAIFGVVGYIVLVELALPVQQIPDEVICSVKHILLGPFETESAGWLLATFIPRPLFMGWQSGCNRGPSQGQKRACLAELHDDGDVR